MSSKDNKPDLSNLKSRLGMDKKKKKGGSGRGGKKKSGGVDDRLAALKKSTLKSKTIDKDEAKEAKRSQASERQASSAPKQTDWAGAGGEAGGGGAQPSQPSQPSQSAQAPQPTPRRSGPPPGAKGPPPTAQKPPTQRAPAKTESPATAADGAGGDDGGDVDLKEMGLDDGSILSPPVIGLLAVLLVMGLIFGYLASQSLQSREIADARINDAQQLESELAEYFESADEALALIDGLESGTVDFESAERLAELDIEVNPRILPGNRILLGDQVIGPLNRYMGLTSAMQRLMEYHGRVTSGIDRDELESIVDQQEKLDDDEHIGVVFDLYELRLHMARMANEEAEIEDYDPLAGRLVTYAKEPEIDEEGRVDIHVLASNAGDEAEWMSLIPIVPEDFIDIETNNALNRYDHRVQELQRYAEELSRLRGSVEQSVQEAASAERPPLLTFRGSQETIDEMEEEIAEELDDIDDE